MLKRKLGKTDLELSVLGFGAIPIINKSKEDAISIIHKAFDMGVNYFDTALGYGDTEEKIGLAFKGTNEKIYVSTKTTHRSGKEVSESIEKSLLRLQRETIDIMFMHAVDNEPEMEMILSESMKALQDARKEGKIRYIGISSHNNEVLVKAIRTGQFDVILATYNITQQEAAKEVFPLARSSGIGTICMKPLAGGALGLPYELEKFNTGEKMVGVSEACLKFALSREQLDVILVGMGSLREVQENSVLGWRSQCLTRAEVNELLAKAESLGKDFCLQCGYCKPVCPEGIDIPLVFKAQVYEERYGINDITLWNPRRMSNMVEKCTECGKCMEKCPAKLQIPDLLKKTRDMLLAAGHKIKS
jgi:predicted aldo/keto reductase-like oxidoreductase